MGIPELRATIQFLGKDVPHFREVESRGRTSHVHWDGCEVQRQFYVNHFQAAPDVCEALLGFVLRAGDSYVRYLPAFDPIYNQILYCNEARWDHVDGDKKSISAAAAIGGAAGEVPALDAYNHFKIMVNAVGEDKVTVTDEGLIVEGVPGGAFITASYRPLISGYHPQRYQNILTAADRDKQFDYMDPIFTAGTQTVPWPHGVVFVKDGILGGINADDVPAELADPITIPLIQFSVRRMFLGKTPHRALGNLLNKVNHEVWPAEEFSELVWPYTFSQFPAETLRFDSYEEIRHWSQSSDLNKWHEVKLNFSWRHFYDTGLRDRTGQRVTGVNPVTWNHVFAHPFDEFLGWYRIFRRWRGVAAGGDDFYENADFKALFDPVTPQSQ